MPPRELGVSQPTLSRALARFEDQAGTPLFDRVNRRLRLNAYGQIMLEHARRGLAEMHSATERIAALRDPDTGRVRLAFLHSLANWYVPEQLRRFRNSVPAIGFDLFQGPAHEITERVRCGQADIAITAPRPEGSGLVGGGCMSNSSVWPFRAAPARQPSQGTAVRGGRGTVRRTWRPSSACGSSPTNSGRRRTSP